MRRLSPIPFSRMARPALVLGTLALVALGSPACGGGSTNDQNPTSSMALVNFLQAGVNNLALNTRLTFTFSEPVDLQALNSASMQVREGPSFGATVPGNFSISGSQVYFLPSLPGLCDLSDAGFKANVQYRVTLVGYPEQFCLRRDDGNPNTAKGDPLKGTLNFEFHTRAADDPLLFTDGLSGASPSVTGTSYVTPSIPVSTPADGAACMKVEQGNAVTITLSENVRPCTVSSNTVLVDEYERGAKLVKNPDPLGSGRFTGFTPAADGAPLDVFSWGSVVPPESTVSPPQRVRSQVTLAQSFTSTQIVIRPEFGQFPDNALIVVQLTFGIQDFGGNALTAKQFAFTTENLDPQNGVYNVTWDPNPAVPTTSVTLTSSVPPAFRDQSTADANSLRSPNVAQGWLLFSGDADNGSNQLQPTAPANNPPTCNSPRQVNDGVKDDFDPTTDVVLDTGLTVNTCPNKTDGSTAVVWEFKSFTIRTNRTVRIAGVNPAIILVQGDVNIQTGGILRVRGDGVAGTPQGAGGNGTTAINTSSTGGVGVAGSGNGGKAYKLYDAALAGDPGTSAFGSLSPMGTLGGSGAGTGGSNATHASFATNYGCGLGGGGGGHSEVGMDGANNRNANMTYKTAAIPSGGSPYPAMEVKMPTPEAGGGGAGGGYGGYSGTQSFAGYDGTGGGGGSGGGFVDLTSSGNISIAGTIDAAGGRGGNAIGGFYAAGGGGGGGGGGGIRLLTPLNITLAGGTLTTAGGVQGNGANSGAMTNNYAGSGPQNAGGVGGKGRIVLEDGDSLITNQNTASLTPAEGDPSGGFYRGLFDANRFKGGGLEPQLITDIFQAGPSNPDFVTPIQTDFQASIPIGADRGLNGTCCLIEARGYQMLPDGTVNTVLGPTSYRTVGYLRHSGVNSLPTWIANVNPGDVTIPSGNLSGGIGFLNTCEFLQLRVTFYLPSTLGPFDPGPLLDNWVIRFTFDQ